MKVLTTDCETTGLPPKGANWEIHYQDYPYIVSLAYKLDADETRYFIINQEGRPIPPEATAVHGITNEMADASPHKLLDVLAEMCVMGKEATITVGHNIYFDSSIMKANILRMMELDHKIDAKLKEEMFKILHKDRRIDTMQSTIKYCNIPGKYGPKWPKLTELYFQLFNETFNAHNSKDDVDATYKCFIKLLELGIIALPSPETL